jgi:hypothetical protein
LVLYNTNNTIQFTPYNTIVEGILVHINRSKKGSVYNSFVEAHKLTNFEFPHVEPERNTVKCIHFFLTQDLHIINPEKELFFSVKMEKRRIFCVCTTHLCCFYFCAKTFFCFHNFEHKTSLLRDRNISLKIYEFIHSDFAICFCADGCKIL